MIERPSRTALLILAALAATAVPGSSPRASAQTSSACTPSALPADQDIRYGRCLFSSRTDFNQARPGSIFATCNGCHPSNRTDRGTHPVLIANPSGTSVESRQAPNLRNVQFNVPLGWDGRHGGVLGNQASVIAGIKSAAVGAINSPVEMAGRIDVNDPADQAKLSALAAFIISRSPTAPNPNAAPASPVPLPAETLQRIKTGGDVFFGRSESTKGLLQAGKACVGCHPAPFFTDNEVRTNVLHPDAAYDFGFQHADGSIGPVDPGAGLVTVSDAATDTSVQVGTFKTPSLHRFYPDGEPALHGGIFADDGRLFRFYEKSLGFTLAPGESTGLHYWMVFCPQGPERNPSTIHPECGFTTPNPVMVLDTPATNSTIRQPVAAAGWAVDLGALTGSGVDALHVWATRVSDGRSTLVTRATVGLARPDVAAAFGRSQFGSAGFSFVIQGLAPGTYDLGVYARSTVSGTFNQVRFARITVQ